MPGVYEQKIDRNICRRLTLIGASVPKEPLKLPLRERALTAALWASSVTTIAVPHVESIAWLSETATH